MKLFENDKEQRDLLNKIASLCGIKRTSVQQVWEYTIYCLLISVMENRDATYNVLPIPYLGKILFKESKEHQGEFDTFLMIYDSVKEELKKVKKGDMKDLINYFDKNFIEKTIQDIEG